MTTNNDIYQKVIVKGNTLLKLSIFVAILGGVIWLLNVQNSKRRLAQLVEVNEQAGRSVAFRQIKIFVQEYNSGDTAALQKIRDVVQANNQQSLIIEVPMQMTLFLRKKDKFLQINNNYGPTQTEGISFLPNEIEAAKNCLTSEDATKCLANAFSQRNFTQTLMAVDTNAWLYVMKYRRN